MAHSPSQGHGPVPPRPVPRRPVLVALTAALTAPAVAGSLGGCAAAPPDPLVALIMQARSQAALVDAASRALRTPAAGTPIPITQRPAGPDLPEMLDALASARRAHADAMAAELGDDAPPPPPPGQLQGPAPDPGGALAGVVRALDEAQGRAAAEVPVLPRHRAALVGSIAACCAAYRSVLQPTDSTPAQTTPSQPQLTPAQPTQTQAETTQTQPEPTPAHTTPSGPPLAADTAMALQTALGAEHAAVWCYGLVAAFLPAPLERQSRQDADAHRDKRDDTIARLTRAGARPVAAEPAYRTPAPVTDQASAVALALTAESDAAAAWDWVLARCDGPDLRDAGLGGLTDAATRAARWARRAGGKPTVPPFPGRA